LERGEFPAAAWMGDRLLNWHPNLNDDRPQILYRTALAYHLVGNNPQAAARLKTLQEKFPQASGMVRGNQVVLVDSLTKELATAQAKPRELAGDSWPMPFGSPDRARVPQVSGFGGAHLLSIEVPRLNVRNIPFAQRRQLETQVEHNIAEGAVTGIFPVVDRGEIFFQDNARVYAMSLESDQPLPGWARTYDGDRKGRYSINAWPMPASQQFTVALTNDSVLAIMGQPDLTALQFTGTYGQRDTRLVCLDRKTGKENWVNFPKDLPDSAAGLRGVDFLGCPLIVGDTVFIQARGLKGAQFEDFYVLAFDLAGGKFKWACYIASANSGAQFWDGDMASMTSQAVSQLAYSSGRIYALTNLGALASIDAYDGTIVWLNIYPRQVNDHPVGFGWNRFRAAQMAEPTKPWTYNPVIVTQGKVFVLPADGQFVHIYDAGSGVEFKRIKLADYNNAQALLGIVDEKLLLSDARQVYCIDWPAYDPAKDPNDNLLWKTNAFQRPGVADDFQSIRGRGFVTADSVLIPTAWQLYRLSLRTGSIVQRYPDGPDATWAEDEGAGNVLMTQDRLLIAGPTLGNSMRINIYTDLSVATSRLDASVASAPADPAVRLKYARILFSAGKPAAATAKLDDAIKLINANGSSHDPIFTTAMDFAQKLAKQHNEATTDLTASLFDRAAAAATTPRQNVEYRMSRAQYAKDRNQPRDQVQLYQQILSDASLRSVPVADSDGNSVAASLLAKREIDEAIHNSGPQIYAAFEHAADQMLDDAN
ncbi:MAG TPA: PQQ-binding-like beta-propeller repeat protein, partial [Tepidisphaeraceae bacterium]